MTIAAMHNPTSVAIKIPPTAAAGGDQPLFQKKRDDDGA